MRSDAFLINIARGDVIDEAALVKTLRAGAIAGAGLDVFGAEPLAADRYWRNGPKKTKSPDSSSRQGLKS